MVPTSAAAVVVVQNKVCACVVYERTRRDRDPQSRATAPERETLLVTAVLRPPHQTPMDLECQRQLSDITGPIQGTAGALLDSM